MPTGAYTRITDTLGSLIDLSAKVESNLIKATELHGTIEDSKLANLERHLDDCHLNLQQSLVQSQQLTKDS
jgi:hypothetical protein